MNSEECSLEKVIGAYDSIGPEARNMKFLAKWVYDIYEKLFYLPSINSIYKKKLALDKSKLSIFAILIDDLADNSNLRDLNLMDKAIRIPWDADKECQNAYLETTREIWLDAINSIKQYPRYNEFKEIFYFDMEQFLHAIRYSYLINTMEMDNDVETKMYSYHNMMIIVFMSMDLMCSPDFEKKELKYIRPVFHYMQDICHIGNILSTYKREIREQDFSCPLISMGLRKGIIDKKTIEEYPEVAEEKLKSLEEYFRRRAEDNFSKIQKAETEIKSVDINEFRIKLRKVYEAFLEREKYWELQKDGDSRQISSTLS